MGDGVLLLDGNARSALAVTRSLGSRGVVVTVAAETHPCLAGCSKYCRDTLIYPSPMEHPEGFTSWLKRLLSGRDYSMVLPMTDIITVLLAEARDELPSSVSMPLPALDSLQAVLDKSSLIRLASEAGIPIPETLDVRPGGVDLPGLVSQFPVVVKSRKSFERVADQWIEGEFKIAHDQKELTRFHDILHGKIPFPLIQEYIPGYGAGIFVLCNHGKLRALFAHKRLRETPARGGVSTLRESIPADPGLVSSISTLLERLEWHGAAMFEFRIDNRDNTPKLMEVNPRFWGSLHLALVSGQDFPWLLYQMAMEGDIELSDDYKCGIRSRWLLGDFNRLLLTMFRHRNGATRRQELLGFLKHGKDTYLEIESFLDLKPALYEYRTYALDLLRSSTKKLLHRSNTR
jgi:predicted ATP-grasp superfamily ATP-dependent carboligase